ncbi:MAG: sirohydrochlorin cobaltochelatase [Bacteroidales bacterium]|nr:sirohydrochlorin cobaltochelatase [Bacteroidales bacterium]
MLKLLVCVVAALISTGAVNAQSAPTKKTGVLLVHYGTRNDASRQATIEKINAMAAERFAGCEVVEAYAAAAVIKALAKQGVHKPTIAQALDSLVARGCENAVVQTTMLLDGVMNDIVKNEVKNYSDKFKHTAVGLPLLYSVDDCRRMLDVIDSHIHPQADEQVVIVGHGSDSPANAIYSQLACLAQLEGRPLWHVGTIEGFPTLENVMAQLARSPHKKVAVVPLLFIAGNHNRDDIRGEWGEALSAAGYSVRFIDEGLGEIPAIQQSILSKIDQSIKNIK